MKWVAYKTAANSLFVLGNDKISQDDDPNTNIEYIWVYKYDDKHHKR